MSQLVGRTVWHWSLRKPGILADGRDDALYYYSKRLVDSLAAAGLILILLPVMAIIAFLIKLTSPGPVFFVQERVGAKRRIDERGRIVWGVQRFRVFKFRSMVHNADESLHIEHIKAFVNGTLDASNAGDANFKLQEDPRITWIGHIIRKTSLDELPQLINVLKGEMSLVGPRPVPTYEVDGYQDQHYERLAALPGITGLWQVMGRSAVSFEEMIRMDIDYVHRQSLLLDLKILLMTIPAVLSGRGAD
jgi:lipopolysaccharide/colanic/teichoic acid biosynthesis glycosyltransferase